MIAPAVSRLHLALTGVAIVVVAALLVWTVGLFVATGPVAVDRAILAAVRGAGPASLRGAVTDLTALGSGAVLTLVVAAAAILLLVRRQPAIAALLIAGCWSGGRVVAVVKDLIGRPRPPLADRLVPVTSASFPSAHAADSALVYLTLAALAGYATHDRATRRAGFVLAILLVGAIGASRVYLGVHWPTDVVAGWGFGALWALGWWRLAGGTR